MHGVYGSMRLSVGGKEREVRLGSPGVRGVADWRRAPIARVFFAHDAGEAFELEIEDGRVLEGTVLSRALHGPKPERFFRRRTAATRPFELDAVQRRIVELPEDRSALVLGEAGFGKTTVAFERLIRLHPSRALVVVPTRGLVRLWKRMLERRQIPDVEVTTFEAWIRAQARAMFAGLPERDSAGTTPATSRLKRHPALREVLPIVAGMRRGQVKRSDLLHLFGDSALVERVAASGGLPRHAVAEVLEHTHVQFSETTEHAHRHVDRDKLITSDGKRIDEGTPMEDAESIDAEDCAVLIALHHLRTGTDRTRRGRLATYEHVVLDEAQELAPIELEILGRAVASGGTVTVAGDEAQQTDPGACFPGWDGAMRELGVPGAERWTLAESHRCPPEVTELARAIAGRPGAPPRETDRLRVTAHPNGLHLMASLIDALRAIESEDRTATIGVVYRTARAAKDAHETLGPAIGARLALDGGFDFRPGTVVTSVAEVKGLELDCVVVPDANDASYPDTPESRRALYVAATRALHQLWVASVGAPTAVLPRMRP